MTHHHPDSHDSADRPPAPDDQAGVDAPGSAASTDEPTVEDEAVPVADGAAAPDQLSDDGSAQAPEDRDPDPDTEVAEPRDPVAAAEQERDQYLDALRRKQAEFENFRKRMMREGATQRIAGHAEVAERMLDVLDDFDRTLEAAGDVDPGFLKGVQLVHDKLARVLADFGVTRIDDIDTAFDPNRHEAVQQVAAEQERDEPVVTQVLRPGYELAGRTLRAAMVVVEQ